MSGLPRRCNCPDARHTHGALAVPTTHGQEEHGVVVFAEEHQPPRHRAPGPVAGLPFRTGPYRHPQATPRDGVEVAGERGRRANEAAAGAVLCSIQWGQTKVMICRGRRVKVMICRAMKVTTPTTARPSDRRFERG